MTVTCAVPAVERLLHTLSALKPFFLSQSKLVALIKTFFLEMF